MNSWFEAPVDPTARLWCGKRATGAETCIRCGYAIVSRFDDTRRVTCEGCVQRYYRKRKANTPPDAKSYLAIFREEFLVDCPMCGAEAGKRCLTMPTKTTKQTGSANLPLKGRWHCHSLRRTAASQLPYISDFDYYQLTGNARVKRLVSQS